MPNLESLQRMDEPKTTAAALGSSAPHRPQSHAAGTVCQPSWLYAGLMALLLVGCPSPQSRRHWRPALVPESQVARTTSQGLCRQTPRGAEPLLLPGAVTLLGELHGTVEIPAFVARLACAAAEKGLHVAVGLEAPQELTENFLRYLQSAGDAQARNELMQGEFWHFNDGRASQGMVALLDALRTLSQSGKRISLFLIDGNHESAETRDRQMATRLATLVGASPTAVTLVLLGNLHARTGSAEWAGWHLKGWLPRLHALDVSYANGSAWCCTRRGCGPHRSSGEDLGPDPFVELFPSPNADGYTGRHYVGPISASPPAVRKDAASLARPSRPPQAEPR